MTSATSSFRAPPWLERWRASRTPRERAVVAALVVVIVVALAWLAIWQPLQRDLGALASAAPAERQALAAARKMADEMAALGRNAPVRRASDARDRARARPERARSAWQRHLARLAGRPCTHRLRRRER
jgi:type II secretory pathway component PulM